MNWLLNQEPIVRLGCFCLIFLAMFVWERVAPRRRLTLRHKQRFVSNLLLAAINTVLLRLLPGVAAVAVAVRLEQHPAGLLYLFDLPRWLHIVLAFVLLDLVVYTQHLLFHIVPWCWRMHRVHHSDEGFDVSTGVRFHPLEILLSMLIKMGAVLLIGAPVAAVIIFEVILNATSLFNHGNVKFNAALDRLLRILIVTPDMHRVHHSVIRRETDSNFGFNFSFWDRLFGTYKAQPDAGHQAMQIGLTEYHGRATINILSLLIQPFKQSRG
ncbi:MAG: sterol desaturase family protein [Gammaproteobacteria bacterium]